MPSDEIQKILDDRVPMLAGDGFGVELHAVGVMRFVGKPHDKAVISGGGGDFEAVRQRAPLDYQRVIACGFKGHRQAFENTAPFMIHITHLAMHWLRRADDFPAKRLANRLLA